MRSKFEERFAADLTARGIDFRYESVHLQYPKKDGFYHVDFLISRGGPLPGKPAAPTVVPGIPGILIETKGLFSSADRTKMLAVKAAYPSLDIRFVFQRATNRLSKTSKMAYWQWAEKHGFRWAEQVVPDGWLV